MKNRNKEVKFRLTEMELTILQDKARDRNMSVSDFLRKAIIPSHEEYYVDSSNKHIYCINYKDNMLLVRTDSGEWIDDTPDAVLRGDITIGNYLDSR